MAAFVGQYNAYGKVEEKGRKGEEIRWKDESSLLQILRTLY